MNDFLSAMPWRLASLAALVVAGLSIVNGADTWVVIERCGIAFGAFFCLASIAKALLEAADPRRAHASRRRSGTGSGESRMG